MSGTGAVIKTANCYILQDDSHGEELTEAHFSRDFWQEKPEFQSMPGGRGGSCRITIDGRRAVLRPYYRGGLVSKIFSDQYVWLGKQRSRPWREWQVLRKARAVGLPVPDPIGACVCRSGLIYRAALITAYLEDTEMLTARLSREKLDAELWYRLGTLIKRLQAEGIRHADLNSDNILLDSQNRFYLLDFDKARIMPKLDDWQWRPLYRLQRSIVKRDRSQGLHYNEDDWQSFMDGYQSSAD